MKKFIAGFLAGALFFSGTLVLAASQQTISAYFGSIKLVVDGKPVNKDTLLYNGTTYVPLRAAAEILGKAVDYDENTKTAYIGSSPKQQGSTSTPTTSSAQADIITVSPRTAEVVLNTSVSIKVTGNINCEEAKIVDPSGNTVATSKDFLLSSIGNKEFTLKFSPSKIGKYTAYVADANGTVASRSLPIEITVGSSATVNKVTSSSSTAVLDDTVTLTVTTSSDAEGVELVSEDYSSDNFKTTNYSTSGKERVFKMDWRLRTSYYSGMTSVSAKVYALDEDGRRGEYKSVSISLDEDGAVIHDASASKTSIDTDTDTTLEVVTSTSVTRVSFDITSGDGELYKTRLTSYEDERSGKRYWENTFTSSDSSGTTKIKVTAETSSGATTEKTITITVGGGSSSSGSVSFEQYPSSGAAKKEYVDLTVITGKSVEEIEWVVKHNKDGEIDSGYLTDYSGTSTKREWGLGNIDLDNDSGTYTLTVTLYDSNGKKTGTKSYTIK